MAELTQFLVDQIWVHRILKHQSVLGKGRDFLSGKSCTMHYYSDDFDRSYVMQIYEGVQQSFVLDKVSRITKAAYSQTVYNIARISMMSTRKLPKGLFDLAIFYDVTGIYHKSMAQIIGTRISSESPEKEGFKNDQISGFLWQICDMLLLCGQHTGQFLEITPVNIFCTSKIIDGYNYFPNNFGLNFEGTRWNKRYHNPDDEFFKGNKTIENAMKSVMFILGMILLQLVTLTPRSKYYNEKTGQIEQALLKKAIQSVNVAKDKFISSVIKQMLEFNQDKRLTIQKMYKQKQWLKARQFQYYQGKAQFGQYKSFQGLISQKKQIAHGQGINKDNCMQRGVFVKHTLTMGSRQDINGDIEIGKFQDGKLVDGQKIVKHKYISIGKFRQDKIEKGIRLTLNTDLNNKQQKKMAAFSGQFKNDEPYKGRMIFSDGSEIQYNA